MKRPGRFLLLTLAASGLGTETVVAQATAADPFLLDCSTIPKTADEAFLVKRFGRENVASVTLDGAEGQSERGTAIYPKDPARRLEIFWWDVAKRRRPASIAVRGRSSWQIRTPGTARGQLARGATLGDVESANERPFRLNGFAWDMGGYATGWEGGKLDALPGGCTLSVRFNPDPSITGRALDKVSGDKELASSDKGLRAVRPTVSSMTLDWAE